MRKIQIAAVAVILFTLFIASSVAQPTGSAASPSKKNLSAPVVVADWTFSGCWTQFSSQPCRDVFVDQQGQHWICKACGTTGKPGPGKCNPIGQRTLDSGLWCS